MAVTLTGTVKYSSTHTLTNETSTASDITTTNQTNSFANGTGANQANTSWYDTRTLGSGATEDLDLFDLAAFNSGGGAGLNSLGQAVTIQGIKTLYVKNHDTSTGTLTVGNKNAVTAWQSIFNASDTGAITLPPGAWFAYCDPSAAGADVTDADNHLLTFTDSSGGCTFDVEFIGID